MIGNIAAGKSTMVDRLSDALRLPAVEERFAENPFLLEFYADPARRAFQSQLWFTTEAIDRHAAVARGAVGGVQEQMPHSILGVMTRALHDEGYVSAAEFSTLAWLVDTIGEMLPAPDLVLRVRAPVETLLERISERGRDFERGIASAYLWRIEATLDAFVRGWPAPVLSVSTVEFDVRTDRGLTAVVDAVRAALPSRQGA